MYCVRQKINIFVVLFFFPYCYAQNRQWFEKHIRACVNSKHVHGSCGIIVLYLYNLIESARMRGCIRTFVRTHYIKGEKELDFPYDLANDL
jgi:cytochrome b561